MSEGDVIEPNEMEVIKKRVTVTNTNTNYKY